MLRRFNVAFAAVLLLGIVLLVAGRVRQEQRRAAGIGHGAPGALADAKVRVSLMSLPLAFEENRGQIDPKVFFHARSAGGSVSVTGTGATFTLAGDPPDDGRVLRHNVILERRTRQKPASFRMRVIGASSDTRPVGANELPGKANYFIGNDASKWRTNIPTFEEVRVTGVYPGVDLVYYGNKGRLEYDFHVAPGVDSNVIRVAFEGVDQTHLDENGNLVLAIGGREVIQRRPRVFQEEGGNRRELGSAFVLLGNHEVAFRVDGRNRRRAMIIDPALIYSTPINGGSTGPCIAVDGQGNVYVTGYSVSLNQPPYNGGDLYARYDAFVEKISVDASGLYSVYYTYVGGLSMSGNVPGSTYGDAIALDSQGSAYITGYTIATDFPTVNAFQTRNNGAGDGFVVKVSQNGSQLLYSTYLGGSKFDQGGGIAVDAQGAVYVTGYTSSTDFPTAPTSPLQGSYGGGDEDAFVAKINPAGSGLVYSTYIGASQIDEGHGIAVDGQGNAYVTGTTESTDFHTVSPIANSGGGPRDAFVLKINSVGSALLYSTRLGGSGSDYGSGIAVDAQGEAFVIGSTWSADFPTRNALQPFVGPSDAFIAKLNAAGDGILYSTYLGGSGVDSGMGIAIDGQGNAYVTGWTDSLDFPTMSPLQTSNKGRRDVFVAKINSAGSGLVYSTYLGGSNDDWGYGISVDGQGNAYVFASTSSGDFPSIGAVQGATGSVFVAKISATIDLTLSAVSPQSGPPSGGTTVTLTGGNFPGDAQVTFDGIPATSVVVTDPSRITAVSPPHAVGSVDVLVKSGGQFSTLSGAFTYADPPTITSIAPTSGSSIGGTQVTITGDHFVAGATVQFGKLAAESVTVVNSTTILATAPSQVAGAVDITVTNADGQTATLPAAFSYWTQQPREGCGIGAGPDTPALLLALAGLALLRLRRRAR